MRVYGQEAIDTVRGIHARCAMFNLFGEEFYITHVSEVKYDKYLIQAVDVTLEQVRRKDEKHF